ncbi:acetylxylan esterase [Streptomyces sp. NPDC004014]
MFTDLPYADLLAYRYDGAEPNDFDAFWAETLSQARRAAAPPVIKTVAVGLIHADAYDVTFSGFDGQLVRAWLWLPRGVPRPLPAVVEYLGYGGARGGALQPTLWASLGYAHFVMDSRGQSSDHGAADTPDGDLDPQVGGVMTRGVARPHDHYYRRLFTDAVRAVDTVAALAEVDANRVVVKGGSQGGAMALAVSGLHEGVAGACVDVPFLCHVRRATQITDAHPYREITDYLQGRRDRVEEVFHTFSYLDGANFAARATAPVRFSVGLMDPVCPPSTVFAAYHRWGERSASRVDKDIRVWEYSAHEGGGDHQIAEHVAFLAGLTGG